MAIFVLSDLHLSTDLSENKSMEVFGDRWQDYMQKIRRNWNAVVTENDTVVVPGDISWATRLEESKSDLSFLDSLNGKKLIGKGNHDFGGQQHQKCISSSMKTNSHPSLFFITTPTLSRTE